VTRRRKLSKAQSEELHFRHRLMERYGIRRLFHEEYLDLCLTARWADVMVRQSTWRSVRRVRIRHIEALCVFDDLRWRLITALPREIRTVDMIHRYLSRR
jgi:hypothetical protein